MAIENINLKFQYLVVGSFMEYGDYKKYFNTSIVEHLFSIMTLEEDDIFDISYLWAHIDDNLRTYRHIALKMIFFKHKWIVSTLIIPTL